MLGAGAAGTWSVRSVVAAGQGAVLWRKRRSQEGWWWWWWCMWWWWRQGEGISLMRVSIHSIKMNGCWAYSGGSCNKKLFHRMLLFLRNTFYASSSQYMHEDIELYLFLQSRFDRGKTVVHYSELQKEISHTISTTKSRCNPLGPFRQGTL